MVLRNPPNVATVHLWVQSSRSSLGIVPEAKPQRTSSAKWQATVMHLAVDKPPSRTSAQGRMAQPRQKPCHHQGEGLTVRQKGELLAGLGGFTNLFKPAKTTYCFTDLRFVSRSTLCSNMIGPLQLTGTPFWSCLDTPKAPFPLGL